MHTENAVLTGGEGLYVVNFWQEGLTLVAFEVHLLRGQTAISSMFICEVELSQTAGFVSLLAPSPFISSTLI